MADERGEPSTLVASIDDTATGRWQITTETGSTYVVDLDQRFITRVPELRALRRDHEPLLLHRVLDARVGDTGCFLVQIRSNDLPTLRITSPITRISELRTGPADAHVVHGRSGMSGFSPKQRGGSEDHSEPEVSAGLGHPRPYDPASRKHRIRRSRGRVLWITRMTGLSGPSSRASG